MVAVGRRGKLDPEKLVRTMDGVRTLLQLRAHCARRRGPFALAETLPHSFRPLRILQGAATLGL